jgi:hypothetical protein
MAVITSSAYPGADIGLFLLFNSSDSTVILRASATKGNSTVPVTGAEVKLLIHRTFGLLTVDEAKTTDKNGMATFRLPDNLPGDTSGNIMVSARFVNEELFGSSTKDTSLCAGIKTIPVNLVADRAMWNNVRKAPVWLILTYSLGLLTALGFIFYVLMKLRDIFIVGETLSSEKPSKEK